VVVCCFGKHICNIFLCWFLGSVDFTCSHIYFAKILLHIELGWLSYTGLTFQYCGLRSYCWGWKVCQNGVVAIMQNNPDAVVAGLTGICVDLNKHASHSNSIDASCHVISSTCKLYFSPYELLNGWWLWTQKLGGSLHHFCCCKASWVGTCLRSLEM
jgi:hypothetical protein